MLKKIGIVLILLTTAIIGQTKHDEIAEYQVIKNNLMKGWNTWNSRSITSYVLLPECFAVNLAFKQHYWLEEGYLREVLIGRYDDDSEQIKPGPHTLNGSYSQLEIKWEELNANIETAHDGDDLVILITPLAETINVVKLIVESGMLWNRPGKLTKHKNSLSAELPDRKVNVYATAEHIDDPYVQTTTPYLSIVLNKPVGISSGKSRSIDEIKYIIESQKTKMMKKSEKYGELSDAYIAVQSGIAWNTIYEPKHNRAVSTVGRLWNEEYGGYCLFGWDNFFLAYMTSLFDKNLAFANLFEHLKGKTEEGFIPNDNRGNGSKSFDRSQPPVGSIMVKEIYKRYPERWLLENTFDDLLNWNRWWVKKRNNEGLLSYGSHVTKNPFNEPSVNSKRTAGYESGMDDSPMYEGVPFNKTKNTLELQDVGLNSLYLADCNALIEMADILGREEEKKELISRSDNVKENMNKLWNEEIGFYLNKRTDTGEFSSKLSPTLFYPMLAEIPDENKIDRILNDHFYNPDEFYGEFMLPSIARNDPAFKKQKYWKGAIWPPLNFLTYLSLRKAGKFEAAEELAENSLKIFLTEWEKKGYVSENYSAITGTGDDTRLSSDKFHSWGSLMGIISFIDKGFLSETEVKIEK